MIPGNVENVFLESMVHPILKTREDYSQVLYDMLEGEDKR